MPKPFQVGGRYTIGQEVYYAMHRMRLWEWYCRYYKKSIDIRDTTRVYKRSTKTLQAVCVSLGLSTAGTKEDLIARLDWYDFTAEQLQTF